MFTTLSAFCGAVRVLRRSRCCRWRQASSEYGRVIDALVLKTLPVTNPEQLVTLKWGDYNFQQFELPRFGDLTQVLSGIAGICPLGRPNVMLNGPGGGTDPGQVRVACVTGNYLRLLGVNGLVGRALTPDDDRAEGAHPVAVIGNGYGECLFCPVRRRRWTNLHGERNHVHRSWCNTPRIYRRVGANADGHQVANGITG
jgi:hypothetical protein